MHVAKRKAIKKQDKKKHIKNVQNILLMENIAMEHMHKDIEFLKREVSIITYILSQEGTLTEEAKKRLAKARESPNAEYLEI